MLLSVSYVLQLVKFTKPECPKKPGYLTLRLLEEERRLFQAEHDNLKQQVNDWRDAAELANTEKAQLIERVSWLPKLEAGLPSASETNRVSQADILKLSKSEVEKTRLLQSTESLLAEVEREQIETKRLLDISTT
jgi:hypothetical protein